MRVRPLVVALGLVALAGPGTACSVFLPWDDLSKGTPIEQDASAKVDAATEQDAILEKDPQGCPTGRGPTMVRIGAGDYCIDSTEVTQAEYDAFLHEAGNAL